MVEKRSRRALLAALGAGLAGCSGSPNSSTTPTTSATPKSSQTPTTSSTPKSSQTPDEIKQLPAEKPELAWAIQIPGHIAGSPAVSESRDQIYVGTGSNNIVTDGEEEPNSDGEVFALHRSDGSTTWRKHTNTPVTDQPVVDDGRVYVATGLSTGYTGRNYQIIAYDQDGTRRWETEPQDNFLSIVATHGGNVFVGTRDDHLVSEGETVFAIDSKGELQWQRGAGDVNGGTFAGGLVLYVDIDGVTAYDPARGRTVWEVAGRPISSRDSSVTVIDGLYFRDSERDSSRLNALIAHSITDGNEQWRYADAPGRDDTFDLRDVAAVPEGADGGGVDADIVGIERSGAVFALTKDDGSELWTFQADADTYDVDAVSDTVYVSDINGTVYALSLSDGQEQWRISLPDSAALWAVPSGVVGYCGGYEQTFASVAADGTERWSYKTTNDLTTPVVTDDRIYTYSSDGSVLAFIIDTK